MLLKACRNFERFFELAEGEAYEEWTDEHSLKIPGWAEASVDEFEEIQRRKDQRETIETLFPGTLVFVPANDRSLFPFIDKTPQGLNSVSPAEWVLVDVIADSGASSLNNDFRKPLYTPKSFPLTMPPVRIMHNPH